METGKPRWRAASVEHDHYRLHVTHQTTQAESYHCFPSQREAALWLAEQAGVQAVLSLVFGPTCYYCQQAKEA